MIEVKNLTLSFGGHPVLKGLHFALEKGSITAVIGPNGCGKSTLLGAISGGRPYGAGSILLNGRERREIPQKELAKLLAILPQKKSVPGDLTVRELVSYGRYPHLGFWERLGPGDRARIDGALELLGLTHLAGRPMGTLSGGEAQRVWVALCLVQEPEILLLDEPTTYLDIAYQYEILDRVERLNRELGLTILMVLHDVNQAARYAHRILALGGGGILADGSPKAVITPSVLKTVFGISGRVLLDEESGCPYFLPGGGVCL